MTVENTSASGHSYLLALPLEILQGIFLSYCDMRTVARFERASSGTKKFVESLPRHNAHVFKSQFPANARQLSRSYIAVNKSSIRWYSLPMLPPSQWLYGQVMESYTSETCILCKGEGHSGVYTSPTVVNATDGLKTCLTHMHDTPSYRLGLHISDMLDWAHEGGRTIAFAKNYSGMVNRNGKPFAYLEELDLAAKRIKLLTYEEEYDIEPYWQPEDAYNAIPIYDLQDEYYPGEVPSEDNDDEESEN
ncbi:hypothetical protein BJ170DRAFT_680710 [Xylariales sp. AK1849]|nr:hypothetical protein BJ170DRAFT_680710 [Xylariales sp. AK1849]